MANVGETGAPVLLGSLTLHTEPDPIILDCRACGGSGLGEPIGHFDHRHCDACGGTGVRTCDRAGCHEAAVVASDGNADFCEGCGTAIARAAFRRWLADLFHVEFVTGGAL